MKRNLTKLICLLIVSALMLAAFVSCNKTQPEDTTSADTTPQTEETTAEETTQAATEAAPTTTAEIVALFNESANKIKTNATKVVKN